MSENIERVSNFLESGENETTTNEEMGVRSLTPEPSIITPTFSITENIDEIIKWSKEKSDGFLQRYNGKEVTNYDIELFEVDRKSFRQIVTTLEKMRTEELRPAKEEIGRVESKIREAISNFNESIKFIDGFLEKKEEEMIGLFRKELVSSTIEMAEVLGLKKEYYDGIAFPDSFLKKKNHTKKAVEETKKSVLQDLLNIQQTAEERVAFAELMCSQYSTQFNLVNKISIDELGIVVEETETSKIALKIQEIAERKLREQEKVKEVVGEKQNQPQEISEIVTCVVEKLDTNKSLPIPPEPDMNQRKSFVATIEYSSNQAEWLNTVFAMAKVKVKRINKEG